MVPMMNDRKAGIHECKSFFILHRWENLIVFQKFLNYFIHGTFRMRTHRRPCPFTIPLNSPVEFRHHSSPQYSDRVIIPCCAVEGS
ncbi:MAG: hypothetical protein [Cressdnaviricota sp.]|nr:MAG: hypothetical protein [Cressdnaviricota sp.]